MEKNTSVLLLRYSNYKKYDFIKEHSTEIENNGSVWMLKLGKTIPENKLRPLYENGGTLLLRAPKASGAKFYKVGVERFYIGKANAQMNYPDYYRVMLDDVNMWMMDGLNGTWFKVNCIEELSRDVVDHLSLVSNGKKADDVLNSTRTAMLYVQSDIDF